MTINKFKNEKIFLPTNFIDSIISTIIVYSYKKDIAKNE